MMKRMIRNISLLLSVIVTLVACERKPIMDECICDSSLKLPIDIDWTRSDIDLQNVSVLFYDKTSGKLVLEHTYEHNSKDIQSYANLPVGEYNAVVFNELRGQIDYVSCVGYKNFETLKFESNDDDPIRVRTESPVSTTTRSYIKQSGDLAVMTIRDIKVTEQTIVEAAQVDSDPDSEQVSKETHQTLNQLVGVEPVKRNNTIDITIHIEGLDNARMPALADLTNIADGYYPGSDTNSTTPSTIQFTMDNKKFDEGSTTDGTISIQLSAFGAMGSRISTDHYSADTKRIILDVLFKLIDKAQTEVQREMDVTDSIVFTEQEDGSELLTIYASIGYDPIDPEVDPEVKPLPEVEPEEHGENSGFGSSVEDWGDRVIVPLN